MLAVKNNLSSFSHNSLPSFFPITRIVILSPDGYLKRGVDVLVNVEVENNVVRYTVCRDFRTEREESRINTVRMFRDHPRLGDVIWKIVHLPGKLAGGLR